MCWFYNNHWPARRSDHRPLEVTNAGDLASRSFRPTNEIGHCIAIASCTWNVKLYVWCFCVVSEAVSAASMCNFVRQFSPRIFHRLYLNFAWLLLRIICSAVRKMVYIDRLFKVTEVKLWPFSWFLPILSKSVVLISANLYINIAVDNTKSIKENLSY